MKLGLIALLILSPVAYSFAGVMTKKATLSVPPFAQMALGSALTMVFALCASFWLERADARFNMGGLYAALPVLILGTIANFIGLRALIGAFQEAPVWLVQIFQLLMPVAGAVFAYFLLKESIDSKL